MVVLGRERCGFNVLDRAPLNDEVAYRQPMVLPQNRDDLKQRGARCSVEADVELNPSWTHWCACPEGIPGGAGGRETTGQSLWRDLPEATGLRDVITRVAPQRAQAFGAKRERSRVVHEQLPDNFRCGVRCTGGLGFNEDQVDRSGSWKKNDIDQPTRLSDPTSPDGTGGGEPECSRVLDDRVLNARFATWRHLHRRNEGWAMVKGCSRTRWDSAHPGETGPRHSD